MRVARMIVAQTKVFISLQPLSRHPRARRISRTRASLKRMFWISDIFLRHISEKLYINKLLAGYDRSAYPIGFRISFYT